MGSFKRQARRKSLSHNAAIESEGAASPFENPVNARGGLARLPIRGELSGDLYEFCVSLSEKHQEGILDKLSLKTPGAPFFALGLANQLTIMECVADENDGTDAHPSSQ